MRRPERNMIGENSAADGGRNMRVSWGSMIRHSTILFGSMTEPEGPIGIKDEAGEEAYDLRCDCCGVEWWADKEGQVWRV